MKARVTRKWKKRQASNCYVQTAEESVTTDNVKLTVPGVIVSLKTVMEIK